MQLLLLRQLQRVGGYFELRISVAQFFLLTFGLYVLLFILHSLPFEVSRKGN